MRNAEDMFSNSQNFVRLSSVERAPSCRDREAEMTLKSWFNRTSASSHSDISLETELESADAVPSSLGISDPVATAA